ncbi:MAG: hypothetical protein KJ077_11025 [Anaerolineae bacterium]|nr:hypothetical protein [Anaerolineae bacterium]
MHPAEQLLSRLERTNTHTEAWRAYIRQRAKEVQRWIDLLRWFASLKPGRVADACNARAERLQVRLDQLLQFS